jgi:hypothetical protein
VFQTYALFYFFPIVIRNGKIVKSTVPPRTNPTYSSGLPTGSCDGGKKETIKANNTARKPIPANAHMPFVPPGTLNDLARSG